MKSLYRSVTFLGLVLILGMASGCGQFGLLPDTGPQQTPVDAPPLAGTAWSLVRLNDSEPIEGTEVTLSFEETNAGGMAGCNSYGGDYTSGPGGSLSFGEVVQTEVFCTEPEGVMDQESEYLDALRQVASYRVTNGQLELQNQAGETTLVFERQ